MTYHGPTTRAGRGTILLFALMIMSSVVVTVSGLTAIILSALQQARAIDNAIVAHYAAESGIEEAIYQLRRTDAMPASQATPQVLSNTASWTRTVSPSEPVVYAGTVPQDSLVELALYDPDQPTTATNIDSVEISWSDSCGNCTYIEETMVAWNPTGGPVVWDTNPATYKHTSSPAVIAAAGKLYRLRIIARGGDIENVQVRAYDSGHAALNVPGRVRIDAFGKFGQVQQRLTVTMPSQTPLSGLYDYVVFSECSLVKGGPITCP
jgi:Tfp pilus assembly protein PilX